MRVLHVVEVDHGGVVSLLRTFAAHQNRAGMDVHVLVPPGVTEVPGTVHRWTPRRRSLPSMLRSVETVRRLVTQLRPDVVHLHSFFPGLLGRVLPAPGSPRVVYQPHSWAFQAVRPHAAAWLVARWERAATRRTDLVVTNCEEELHEARRHGVTAPAGVVGLPLDLDHFRPADQGSARRRLGLGDERVIVCVGRLSRQKGQAELARAWLSRPIPGTVLVLVGEGDPASVIAAAPGAADVGVRLVGASDDVASWLQAADLAVLPSRYEGQSVSMAEALACGVPVVMTEVNGAREAVAPRGEPSAGAVVPVGDMASLLEECTRRLDDEGLRRSEALAARARAERLFALSGVMQRLEDAYTGQLPVTTPSEVLR